MTRIPSKLLKELLDDPEYRVCMRRGIHGHECAGRRTFEHAFYFAGKQINERWSILSICALGHEVDQFQDNGDMNKELHLWIALNRATPEELAPYSKVTNWRHYREYLNSLYGEYIMPFAVEMMI